MIDETVISRLIVKNAVDDFLASLEVDVAIAGSGPSGLVAAKYIAENNASVALFERKLSVGGGMWGGGMMFPKIVVQEDAISILEEFRIDYTEEEGMFVANSIESVAKLTAKAIDSGAKIFNCISVEDVIIRESGISGFVVNWSSVELAGLHVDPLAVRSRFCVDATGHPAEVCHIVQRKVGKLQTTSGEIEGEGSMWAEKSESLVVDNTREIYPNLYVTGMAANAVFGSPRMGPIFGGMLLSGKKVAELIIDRL
ncbi:MAG: thiazole biosynthesis protein [Candidatus Altiarchaeota archaeon]|nr:thiazole biosynthesis protein [Candidatus Altiarchaeota archaeon]